MNFDIEMIKNIVLNPDIYKVILFGIIAFVISDVLILIFCYLMNLFKPKNKKKEGLSKTNRNKNLNNDKKYNEKLIKLSKTGICYLLGNYELNPAVYAFIYRPLCGIFCIVLFCILSRSFNIISAGVMFLIGYLGFHFVLIYIGKRAEKQIEWDIYRALINIDLRLSTGEYLEDCLHATLSGIMHPRFKEAWEELLKNINDKSKTMSESIQILETRFSSERMSAFCKIIENFLTYGASDGLFEDMNKELNGMVEDSSNRTVKDIKHRYEFSSGYLAIAFIILAFMVYNLNFSDNETINTAIILFLGRINEISGEIMF